MNLSLGEIAEACGEGARLVLRGAEAGEKVDSVVIDSRKAAAGCVFLATVGERADGHQFVPEVYGKGAKLVIAQKTPEQVEAEHGVSVSAWGSYLLVEDTFQALKDLAEYYRRKLSIPIVGITGSVGKTSTKEFVACVLAEKYRVLKTEGNLNNEVGLPLTLLSIREWHEAAVVEMGISDFGEMRRLSKMARPNICVITNIGQCHLETLKSRDGILRAKTEIFDFMDENGRVCLNGEDDKLVTIAEVHGRKPCFFGVGGNALEDVYATDVVGRGLWGSEAMLHMTDGVRQAALPDAGMQAVSSDGQPAQSVAALPDAGMPSAFPVKIPLPGSHMVTNSAAAACVGGLLGLSPGQIAAGIGKTAAINGRNRLIKLPRYTLIDDCYNANPVSMKAAIDLLEMADTEKVAILGDMFELGEDSPAMHAQVGAYAAGKGIERILCVGESSRHMYAAALGEAGERREGSGSREVFYFPDKEALFAALEQNPDSLVPRGATVLVKASHGMDFAQVLQRLADKGGEAVSGQRPAIV